MKILLRVAVVFVLISLSFNAVALDVTTYRKFVQKSKSSSSDSQYYRGTLLGYHQGLTEAFTQITDTNKGAINFNGNSFICIPPDLKITPKIIEAAIDSALQSKVNQESFGSDWEKTMVGTFAYMGLWELFPCKIP
jgi:hypothetical protein